MVKKCHGLCDRLDVFCCEKTCTFMKTRLDTEHMAVQKLVERLLERCEIFASRSYASFYKVVPAT